MGCGKSSGRVHAVEYRFNNSKDLDPAPAAVSNPHAHKETERDEEILTLPEILPEAFRLTDLTGLYRSPGKEPVLRLEYAYGYSGAGRRNNLYFMSTGDIVVYPCASFVVLLSVTSNTQRFLGVGEVHKVQGHIGRVSALAISRDRDLIATGETSTYPMIYLWNLPGYTPLCTIDISQVSTGTDLLSFSEDTEYLLSMDVNQEQIIRIYGVKTGDLKLQFSPAPGKIRSVAWSTVEMRRFVSAGEGVLTLWNVDDKEQREEVGEGKSNFTVVKYMQSGEYLTGTEDGKIYQWSGSQLRSSYQILPPGTRITALSIINTTVLVGSSLSKIHIMDSTFSETQSVIDTPGHPISLDQSSNGILCGTSEGCIVMYTKQGRYVLMDGHSEGRLQGVAVDEEKDVLVTCAGDNKIKAWDIERNCCMASGIVEVTKTVTLVQAVAINREGVVAIGHSDGHFTLRASVFQLNNILSVCRRTNSGSVTALEFSSAGDLLALGDSTGVVEIYTVRQDCRLKTGRKMHVAEVVTINWSKSGAFLRSQDAGLEVVYCKSDRCEDIVAESSLSTEQWCKDTLRTQSRLRLYPVSSCKSPISDLHLQGLPNGLLELSNPSLHPVPLAYKSHCSAVSSILWLSDGRSILTTGSEDMTMLLWRLSSTNSTL